MDPYCIALTGKGAVCTNTQKQTHPLPVCGVHWRVHKHAFETHGVDYALRRIEEHNAIALRKKETRERREMRQQRMVDDIVQYAIDARLEGLLFEIDQVVPARRTPVPVSKMARFAQDRQNVHTSTAVNQMKKMLEVILKIHVPEEYRWNMRRCSKTPGEIIAACELSIDASRTMMDKYTVDTVIYEMGAGIYGRVLDGVWQYIKSSPDKSDLCKILTTEMEDNIGMCQQGNLTRLTNILAGYLDGVGGKESHAELLGREFPKLWDIDDEDERVAEGNKILDKVGLTDHTVRNEWIQSLY